jgi:cobalt-zinc-cadmium resistance protein CzcA
MKNQYVRNLADIQIALNHLQLLCQSPEIGDVQGDLETFMSGSEIDTTLFSENPLLAYSKQQVEVATRQKKLETSRALPDLRLGYFTQTLIGRQIVNGQDQYFGSNDWFQGFQVGLSVPLWFVPHTSRVKAAELAIKTAQRVSLQTNSINNSTIRPSGSHQEPKERGVLHPYSLATADLLTRQSRKAFESGELDFTTLLLNLRQALSIREGYLSTLQQYNQSIITLQYLNGNK